MSVNGELAGIFAVKYKPSASTRAGLRALLANPGNSVIPRHAGLPHHAGAARGSYELAVGGIAFPVYSERLRLSGAVGGEADAQGALIAKRRSGAFCLGRGRRADAAQLNALLHGPEPAVRHSGALLVRAAALLGLGGRRFAVPHCRVPAHLGTCGRFSVRYSAKTLNFWLVCTKASNIIRALFTIL